MSIAQEFLRRVVGTPVTRGAPSSFYSSSVEVHASSETSAPVRPRSALGAFIRASSLHIGAAAATASLREELVKDHGLTSGDVDAAYAVSRVTPGTNLLALYALLGHRLGGWRLALQAIAVGSLVPASVAVLVAVLYSRSTSPMVADVMAGARAGGVAVFLGAAIRLLRPQLVAYPRVGAAFALTALLGAWLLPLNLFAVLLIAGTAGAIWLRPR